MFYNGTPIKSLNVKHFEISTNDCTAIPSDLQAGVTCVSKGKKITGTGKSFEFATYGYITTNVPTPIPTNINVIHLGCVEYPVQMTVPMSNITALDFGVSQNIGNIFINNVEHPITVSVLNNMLTVSCSSNIKLQAFYGKDRYI